MKLIWQCSPTRRASNFQTSHTCSLSRRLQTDPAPVVVKIFAELEERVVVEILANEIIECCLSYVVRLVCISFQYVEIGRSGDGALRISVCRSKWHATGFVIRSSSFLRFSVTPVASGWAFDGLGVFRYKCSAVGRSNCGSYWVEGLRIFQN